MDTYIFLDLDDTIFQTRHKCLTTPDEQLATAAIHPDGSSLSYTTPQQRELLSQLHMLGTVIPVTARNLESFRRVQLVFSDMVVLDFGAAIVLPSGALDPIWDSQIRPKIVEHGSQLEEICQYWKQISDRLSLGLRIRVISDFEMPLYVVAKHPDGEVERLQELWHHAHGEFPNEKFFVHHNDNNLSVVPSCMSKRSAVEYLLNGPLNGHPRLVIGAGDSLSDAEFLSLCDFSLIPGSSQLMRTLNQQYEVRRLRSRSQ